MYARRRRGALVGAVLALLLAHAGFVAARHLLNDNHRVLNRGRAYLSSVRWPQRGQAAFVLGNGRPAASPHEQPVPVASLAKVMTAYLTLERYPLSGAQDGFTITVTEAQAQAEAQDQSLVAVRAGEQLTERQLLEALLMRFPVFRQIVSMPSVTLPVAGTVTNYNPLIAEGYAGRTGSDSRPPRSWSSPSPRRAA